MIMIENIEIGLDGKGYKTTISNSHYIYREY